MGSVNITEQLEVVLDNSLKHFLFFKLNLFIDVYITIYNLSLIILHFNYNKLSLIFITSINYYFHMLSFKDSISTRHISTSTSSCKGKKAK